jgi:hypothetical protein
MMPVSVSSWSLSQKTLSAFSRDEECQQGEVPPYVCEYGRKERSEKDNAVGAASIHANEAALAAIAAQFRDGSRA